MGKIENQSNENSSKKSKRADNWNREDRLLRLLRIMSMVSYLMDTSNYGLQFWIIIDYLPAFKMLKENFDLNTALEWWTTRTVEEESRFMETVNGELFQPEDLSFGHDVRFSKLGYNNPSRKLFGQIV